MRRWEESAQTMLRDLSGQVIIMGYLWATFGNLIFCFFRTTTSEVRGVEWVP